MKGKLIIAEDQPNFRKGLLKLAGKRASEWIVVGEAANGQSALTAMEACVPDLLITDIRMPQMDGLQLTREVRSRGWRTKVIMITGFKDFAYAQSALRYGVLDFITKPCVEADILALLDRAYDQLVEEQQSQRQIDIWQRQHEDSQLRSAIVGIAHPAVELAELLEVLAHGEVYFLSVPSYTSADKGYASEDVPLLHFAIDNMIGELGQQWLGERCRLVALSASRWALIIDRAVERLPDDWLWQLSDAVRRYLKLELQWHGPGACRTPEQLRQSYASYSMAVDGAAKPDPAADWLDPAILHELEQRLLASLLSGDSAQVSQELRRHTEQVRSLPLSRARSEALLLATALHRLVRAQFPEWPLAAEAIAWDAVYRCGDPEQAADWLQQRIDAFLEAHREWLARHNDTPVTQAIRYIQSHYAEGCGLAEVAAHVHLNPSYFSHLFKKETGDSVTGYLQGLRMQKAKLLLGSTEMKIFEVAQAVGFNDSNYFTSMFNKLEGLSPKEYRKQRLSKSIDRRIPGD